MNMTGRDSQRPRRAGHGNRSDEFTRRAVCEAAARVMDEEAVRDYRVAKLKACERLGLDLRRTPLPANREIDSALLARIRLFRGRWLAEELGRVHQKAAELMRLFLPFEPRLVGALLRGSITKHTPIELHLFADNPEDVVRHLAHHHIPSEIFDRRVRFAGKRYRLIPGFRFRAEDRIVEILSFTLKQLREAPLCPVEGRPMQRANINAVEALAVQMSSSNSRAGNSVD